LRQRGQGRCPSAQGQHQARAQLAATLGQGFGVRRRVVWRAGALGHAPIIDSARRRAFRADSLRGRAVGSSANNAAASRGGSSSSSAPAISARTRHTAAGVDDREVEGRATGAIDGLGAAVGGTAAAGQGVNRALDLGDVDRPRQTPAGCLQARHRRHPDGGGRAKAKLSAGALRQCRVAGVALAARAKPADQVRSAEAELAAASP
jgi:hypothetical protein